jgi:uncharacterized protein (TIGR02246 family)
MTQTVPPAAKAIAGITEAWANNDATAFAKVFTRDGTMVLPGLYIKGQDGIEQFMTQAYATQYKGTRVTGSPVDMRVIGDDLAIIVTEGGVLLPGETDVAPARRIKATWVVVREGADWRLAAYHNAPAEPAA